MNFETSTSQRPDGSWAATVNDDTCTHRHSSEKVATSCINDEVRALERGRSHWHRAPRSPYVFSPVVTSTGDGETASDEELANSHEYVPMKDLVALWHAVTEGMKTRHAANLMFLGPSGSGKTDGARYLAARVGLPFTKVDAASMTDPEAWFGTREIVVQDGVAVTDYRPSAFVEALGRPGVILIDEITRVRDEHRNVLLPLLDTTRAVTNPLTGDVVNRDPKCVIIMAGNVGIHFTGTSAIDPAFMTRAITVEFDYIDPTTEARIVREATGCDEITAEIFVRFATETRQKAAVDAEFAPISTRELLDAGRLVRDGLDRDLAVKFVVLNAASSEGGTSSIRQELQNIWNGVRVAPRQAAESTWACPKHGSSKIVPAGVSAKTGKAYASFRACDRFDCPLTEDNSKRTVSPATPTAVSGKLCGDCGHVNTVGRNTWCEACGASL